MTGDVNVRNGASGEIEEKSCLDVICHQDHVEDAVEADSGIGNCNDGSNDGNVTVAKDDSDGSYVFVNGNDDEHDDNGVDIVVPDENNGDNGIDVVEADEGNDGNGVDVAESVDVNAESRGLDREIGESDAVQIKDDSGVGDIVDSLVQDDDDTLRSNNVVSLEDVKSEAELANGDLDPDKIEDVSDEHNNKCDLQVDTSEQCELSEIGQGTDVVEESESIPLDTADEIAGNYEIEAEESVVNPPADKETIDETAGKSEAEAEDSVVNPPADEETIDETAEKSEVEAEDSVVNPPADEETIDETAEKSEVEAEDSVVNPAADEETIDPVEKCESIPLATDNETIVISENEAENSVVNPPPDKETIDIVEKSESTSLATADEMAVISEIVAENSVVNPPSDNVTIDLVEESESTPISTADETAVKSEIEAEDSVIKAPSDKETIDLVEESASTPLSAANGTSVKSEIEAEDSVANPPADKKTIDDSRTDGEVEVLDNSNRDIVESQPVDQAELQSEAEKDSAVNDKLSSCVADRELPINEAGSASIKSQEKEATFSNDDLETETKVSVGQVEPHDHISTSIENGHEYGESTENNCSVSASSVEKVEPAPSNDVPVAAESDILSDSVVGDESNRNSACDDVHFQVVSGNESEQTSREVETSTSSAEGSTVDASDGQNTGSEVGRRPFYYIIRIPRYDDENLKEQIKDAQLQVDAKTKSRDAAQTEVRTKRAICKKFGDDFEAAKLEEKSARDLLQAKRKEMDSLQSLINFNDIDGRIRNLEHMIQHETITLKEEKQFIREIKQLKQQREQFSSGMVSQDEEQEVMNKTDHVEERLKVLRKEAESLRVNVMKAEAATKAAKMKYFDERQRLKELQDQFDAAADTRQKTYVHLQNLRAKLKEKNKCFWKYKDDATAAYDLAKKGDKEELQRLCINQVEEVMELWNSNDEFRKEYVRCNVRSTLRRLRTLDGRSLGPDEEPPVIPPLVIDKVAKVNASPSVTIVEKEKEVALVETGRIDNNSVPKVEDKKNQNVKTKKPLKHFVSERDLESVSVTNEIEEERQEEHKPTKEELELARKAETLRKEEEEAALKEQRRLEEKAKAKEAMERKKRAAEKAQARAALRAQKEVEQKEKEKEKRARKKEKKKAAVEDTNIANEGEADPTSVPPSEIKEIEMEEKPVTVTKRAQKHPQFAKQTKVKSIPPPLRIRGKRKMQTWMWVLLIVLLLGVALFYYW